MNNPQVNNPFNELQQQGEIFQQNQPNVEIIPPNQNLVQRNILVNQPKVAPGPKIKTQQDFTKQVSGVFNKALDTFDQYKRWWGIAGMAVILVMVIILSLYFLFSASIHWCNHTGCFLNTYFGGIGRWYVSDFVITVLTAMYFYGVWVESTGKIAFYSIFWLAVVTFLVAGITFKNGFFLVISLYDWAHTPGVCNCITLFVFSNIVLIILDLAFLILFIILIVLTIRAVFVKETEIVFMNKIRAKVNSDDFMENLYEKLDTTEDDFNEKFKNLTGTKHFSTLIKSSVVERMTSNNTGKIKGIPKAFSK